MKVSSNKTIDPPKKKKSSVQLGFKKGKETKEYTPARVLSGHKEYGKEDATKKDAAFIEEARAKKQDIVHKDGKPYRAGHTKVTKEPDTHTIDVEIEHPKFKLAPAAKVEKKVEKKDTGSGKSGGRLKPMNMTFGTDDPKRGGGTKYKKKVRSIRGY